MKLLATILMIFAVCAESVAQLGMKLTDVGMGFAATSVNTAIFRENAVTTCRDTRFVAFYDPDGFLTLGKRALDSGGSGVGAFVLQKSQYKIQKANDAHNVISIAADGDGYLHVSFDQHNSPLRYCRSVAPFSLTLGELTPMVQGAAMLERNVTYPQFFNFKNGDLMFVYRNFNGIVMYYYSTSDHEWRLVLKRLLEFDFSVRPYWQIAIGDDDAIHISWLWRDDSYDVNTNHGIYYACSRDYGRTWQTADGAAMTPVFKRQNTKPVVEIPKNSNLINQTSMCVAPDGRPYIATYYRKNNITNYHLIYYDDGSFRDVVVGNRTTDFNLGGVGTLNPPIARPGVVTDGKKIYYFVRDEQNHSRPVMYCADIRSGEPPVFHGVELSEEDLGAWEPLIDLALWRQKRKIHLFLQRTCQHDNEVIDDQKSTMIKVLEVK